MLLDALRDKQESVLAKKLQQLDERHKAMLRREIKKYGNIRDVPQSAWDEIERDMRSEEVAALLLLAIAIGDDWTTSELKQADVKARGYSQRQYGRYAFSAQRQAATLAAQTTATLRDRLIRKIEDQQISGSGEVGKLTDEGIDQALDDVFTPQRRETIATDQTTQGFSVGQQGAKERVDSGDGASTSDGQRVDIEMYWVAELDERTCPRCRPLHDQPESVWGRVFPNGPGPDAHPNCVLPGQYAQGRIIGASKAFYCGQAIEFTTASGARLSVTPNHPILTEQGFIPANSISEGDEFVRYLGSTKRRSTATNYKYKAPTLIEKVFSTLAKRGSLVRLNPTGIEFHGDAKFFAGDIEIVNTARELLGYSPLEAEQFARERGFIGRDMQLIGKSSLRAFGTDRYGVGLSSPGGPCLAELPLNRSGFAFHALPLDPLLLGGGADACAMFNKMPGDSATGDTEFFRELIDRLSGYVATDEVVDVRYLDYAGHVYDLQTMDGYFYSNGIIIHNCRCSLSPRAIVTKTESYREAEDGRWVTINGNAVKIDDDGTILAGPLKGKKLGKPKAAGKTKQPPDETRKKSRAARRPEKKDSVKSARAKKAYNPSTKEKQDASEQLEHAITKALGGTKSGDNLPMDVTARNGMIGLEVKMVHDGKEDKVHMRKDSRQRKEAWVAEKRGRKAYTVIIDNRDKYQDGKHKAKYSGNRIYWKEGVGAFRFAGMNTATSLGDLKRQLNL